MQQLSGADNIFLLSERDNLACMKEAWQTRKEMKFMMKAKKRLSAARKH